MKVISTKTHGVLDYLMGILLIASPWIFGFANGGAEQWIPIIVGAGALVYSLMTNYEMGVVKTLSMKTHLTLDLMAGILLAASPWIFGFSDRVSTPHLILGLLEIGASLVTKTTPSGSFKTANHSHAV
ncbi:SPW repeat domain-containing protein [Segetibacter aerophilus]|nr:SPW repeat protein [Segetibacter aerophilus]